MNSAPMLPDDVVSSSAIASGTVIHQRLMSPQHRFCYRTHMMWLDLDQLEQLEPLWRKPFSYFKRQDYLGQGDLKAAVLNRMSDLAGSKLTGQVYLLGQVRHLGVYFSPVNFYLLKQDGQFNYMLAEVSNTPWNQRHHYLVPLDRNHRNDKAFHVSPFMPAELQYRWRVRLDSERIRIDIECHQQTKLFWAGLDLSLTPLNQAGLNDVSASLPWVTLHTLFGIYYQAVRLLLKRARFFPHSGRSGDSGC